MRPSARLAAFGAILTLTACGRDEPSFDAGQLQVHEIDCPAPPGSAQPNLTARDGRVYLSWLASSGTGDSLQYAVFEHSRWTPSRTIAVGDSFFANWADFPSLAPLGDGSLVAHWLWKTGGDPYSYGVRIARSADGLGWSAPLVPHRDATDTEHGFVSVVSDGAGGATVVWLDGRQYAGKKEDDPGAQTCLVASQLGAEGFGAETILDERVCDCCQTAAVRTARGVLVAYRDRSDDDVRDIHLVRREGDRWTDPYPLARDGWRIPGCPVNGPALAARDDLVAAAWFTMSGDTARVQVAFSSDAGATFSQPVRLDDGRALGRVDIALLPNGDALAIWLETTDAGEASIRARHVRRDRRADASFEIAATSARRASGFPHVVASGNVLYVAWTENTTPSRIHAASLEVPPAWR